MTEQFDRYRLENKLGQGGMGIVYRAFDTILERVVALKMVLTAEGLDPELRERFFREARAAAHLSHKNIVTIYDLGEHEGRPYLAMEFLDGEDLQRRLARLEKMSLGRKVDLAIEMCQAMDYAHSHGIVHRDLKPANIFITATGGVKVLDFGLARLMTSQLTQSNQLMGTLNYMSPEQVRGERADQQSDVFSIGVVLYELFGGRRAFEGDSVASTLYKILQEVPEPLWRVDPTLPRELTSIVDRALAKLRDERYPDMATLRRDLETFRHLSGLVGPGTPWPATAPMAPLSVPPSAETVMSSPAMSAASAPPASAARDSGAQAVLPRSLSRSLWPWATAAVVAVAILGAWLVTRRGNDAAAVPPVQATRAADNPVRPPAAPPVTPTAAPPAHTEAAQPEVAAPAKPQPNPVPNSSTRNRTPSEPPPPRPGSPARKPAATAQTSPTTSSPSGGVATASQGSASVPAPPPAAAPQPPPQPQPTPERAPVVQPPTVVPASPPPSTPLATSPATVTTPAPIPAGPSAEQAVSDLLARYKDALESRSLDQLKRIWPSLGGGAEAAVRQEFAQAAQITVQIENPHISITGNTGRATFTRRYSLVTVDGQRPQSISPAVMEVHRAGGTWLIDGIRFTSR